MSEGKSLEIGSRDNPSIQYLREGLVPQGSVISVDKEEGWLKILQQPHRERVEPLAANGEKLPVADNSIDLIYAKDLFGSSGEVVYKPDGSLVYELFSENMPKEWGRVCKVGGVVVVGEFSTPYPKEELIKQFEEAGFKVTELNEGKRANDIFGKSRKIISSDALRDNAYSIILEKVN